MTEDRLSAKTSTIKELFAESGNVCAFTGCNAILLPHGEEDNVEIAHIHGVKPGAPRHDPHLSRDKLRAPENLLLMCLKHHRWIDKRENGIDYSVQKVQNMKKDHIEEIRKRLSVFINYSVDVTRSETIKPATNYGGWAKCFDLKGPTLKQEINSIDELQELLSQIPRSTRETLSIILHRGDEKNGHFRIPKQSLHNYHRDSIEEVEGHLSELESKNILEFDLVTRDNQETYTIVVPARFGECFSSFKYYCKSIQQSLDTIILDQNWKILDN